MAREPSYPDDAAVGDPVGGDKKPARAEDEKAPESNRTRHLVAGAAIGIGSAALVAALLYANRARKSDDESK